MAKLDFELSQLHTSQQLLANQKRIFSLKQKITQLQINDGEMEKKAKTLKEHNAKTRIQAQDSWRHFTEASGNLEEARVEGKEAIFALEGEFKRSEVIQE
jgi:hypothetical protein